MHYGYRLGTKVRIKAPEWFRRAYADTWQYENLIGEITGSALISACLGPWVVCPGDRSLFVKAYGVHLDSGTILDHIPEDCLEAVEGV